MKLSSLIEYLQGLDEQNLNVIVEARNCQDKDISNQLERKITFDVILTGDMVLKS